MALFELIRRRNWESLFGYLIFIGMMATGYYYNVTFVQLGLIDLGTRVLGMSETGVAANMALFALLTTAFAVIVGVFMMRRGWSGSFRAKLRLAFASVLLQTMLTALVLAVPGPAGLTTWIVLASLALGIGVPATFGLAVDLIPVRDRGVAAGLITAAAYFAAPVFSAEWRIEAFRAQLLWLMVAGTAGLGVLAWWRAPFLERLARQHLSPAYGRGRLAFRDGKSGSGLSKPFILLLVLMFGIFFADSLGFLRLIDTPALVNTAWRSLDLGPRLAIGVAHVLSALIAGVLYAALDERALFVWVFGLFAMVHFTYTFHVRFVPEQATALSAPILYAVAVSLYTVLNFAIWADLSTPANISRNAALGVALSGWTATFASTALAIQWKLSGMSVDRHLSLVNAVALVFFVAALAAAAWAGPGSREGRQRGRPAGGAA